MAQSQNRSDPGSLEKPMQTTVSLSGLPFIFQAFARIAEGLEQGTLTVRVPDGRMFFFQGRKPGLNAEIVLHDFQALKRLYSGGNVGFAEGYLAGEWDSPDVPALLEMMAQNLDGHRDLLKGRPVTRLVNRLFHLLNRNTRSGSRRNIMAHYDLGNAFYSRWLDPSMTYSSARFKTPAQDLTEAQANKYRELAERMALRPGHSVLEIGCGWGGFAEFAAGEMGCDVTAITISKEQHDFARKRLFEKGLAEKARIVLQDYRDVEGRFDRVASIEMFEAVGERYWPAFFGKVGETLRPNGVAGLQIITIDDRYFDLYRRSVDFIQKHVFPGGMLPSPTALHQQVAKAGLTWVSDVRFGQDYAQTLARWRGRFLGAWDEIKPLGFDERFKRLWTYYLSYCEAGFRAGSIDVAQIAIAKP
jgi:cyclopropane-fatty-acyl-phospholipid synthase